MNNIDFNVFLLKWNIEEVMGYKPQTTFWSDFSIAEVFGKSDPEKGLAAVKDTFNRAFPEWRTNAVYVTELVMVLNHKIWFWYDVMNKHKDPAIVSYADQLSRLYDELWREADTWCLDHLKGEDIQYYIKTTD